MMRVENLVNILKADFYTGVPDSLLKPLCDYLMHTYGVDAKHHIIAANEGNAVAVAAGYHLATGKVPVVYLQNSGEGNIINPLASLLNKKVYAIPCMFIIGWRGEPGVHDEPQHIYQGGVTCRLLEDMGIDYYAMSAETTDAELQEQMEQFKKRFADGHSAALVIRKGALIYDKNVVYENDHTLKREEVIKHIVDASGDGLIISTTGKASRELYEIREKNASAHCRDFLTAGSMGHCSSIALGIALQKPDKTVWCIDGDGAALMHMGALPVIAHCRPKNLIHVIINNGAHESVGGQPTVMEDLNFWEIARDCGYPCSVSVSGIESLDRELWAARERKNLTFIEVKCALGARSDLGRPSLPPVRNKEMFMENIRK